MVINAGLNLAGMLPEQHYVTIGDAKRLKPHPLFDTHFYHDVYRDVEVGGTSALVHYIEHGAREGRAPHPLIDSFYIRDQTDDTRNPLLIYTTAIPGTLSPHPLFDEKYVFDQIGERLHKDQTLLEAYFSDGFDIEPSHNFDPLEYIKKYPDIGSLHPFYHYIRWGKAEGRQAFGRSSSLQGIGPAIEAAAALDPAVLAPWSDYVGLTRISRTTTPLRTEFFLSRLMRDVDLSQPTYVHILNNLVAGGAERVVANMCNAQQKDPAIGQIMVLATGRGSGEDARGWLQFEKCRIIDLADLIEGVDTDQSAFVLGIFLQLLPIKGVCVVNSAVGWALIERHGAAIRQICPLAACAFCYDYDGFGRRAGYAWTHLPYAIDQLDLVITDNRTFADTLRNELRLTEEQGAKITVLYQPSMQPDRRAAVVRQPGSVPRVLWAGRFSAQKRIGLAIEIAKLMEDTRFLLAGGTIADAILPDEDLPSNVYLHGRFSDFGDLPTQHCSAFLYTSQWDGLPNVLLEAAAAGVPIVAPNIGGIAELVNDETGWLIGNHNDPRSYVDALRDCFSHSGEARARTSRLQALIRDRHGPGRFAETVSSLSARRGV